MHDQYTDSDFLDDAEEIEFVSKTQMKREMHELQDLGQRLLNLNPSQQAQLPLSEKLQEALETDRRISSNNAKKRHLQYVGRLMRLENVDAIRTYLERLDSSTEAFNQRFHQLELWRERLLNEGNEALTEYLNLHPQAEVQQMRQLIRKANKELKDGKPPASSRKLFRYLRSLEEQEALEELQQAQLDRPETDTEED